MGVIILVSTAKRSVESSMDYSLRCQRLFIQIILNFFLIYKTSLFKCVHFKGFVLFGTYVREATVWNKWNNRSYMTILLAVPQLFPLVWLVVESNHFCYFSLGHFTVSSQFIHNLWVHSEWFYASTFYILVSNIPCMLVPTLFVGFSL